MRFVWQLVEEGVRAVPAAELAKALAATERSALRAAKITKPARRASTWGCDDGTLACFRVVRPDAPGAACPFVAVCRGAREDASQRCAAIPLTEAELDEEAILEEGLIAWLKSALKVDDSATRKKSPDAREPLKLGVLAGGGRSKDVYFVVRPVGRTLPAFVDGRESVARAALVLVPTLARVPGNLAARTGPGKHVEIAALEDRVVVKNGRLALVTPERARRTPHERREQAPASGRDPMPARRPRRAAITRVPVSLTGAARWEDISIYFVDGHTLRVDIGTRTHRCTFLDLGLANARNAEPTQFWQVLVALCEGEGRFQWKRFGEWGAVKQTMSRGRKALQLVFGLEEDPFAPYAKGEGWKARFRARRHAPRELM